MKNKTLRSSPPNNLGCNFPAIQSEFGIGKLYYTQQILDATPRRSRDGVMKKEIVSVENETTPPTHSLPPPPS
eukprot:scaffold863_cov215-Skeletonema_menzelii.AAC.8